MSTITIPSRDALKSQAKRLRQDLATRGRSISHAEALEAIAHQWGARDWNTLCARAAPADTAPGYAIGQRVSGTYLGHAFDGQVLAARQSGNGYWALVLRFDAPIDVVESSYFSSFRRQVNVTVTPKGTSPQKTSNGQPHLVLSAG